MTNPISNPTSNLAKLTEFAQFLTEADGLLITAGAGMGIDSGLPDFRGEQGFWQAYPPLRHLGKQFVEMANPTLFQTDPKLAWGFYGLRLNSYRQTEPHAGFGLLKRWADKLPNNAFIFTSNVDGQFQKAGFSEQQIMECHGSIHYLQCSHNCHQGIWSADGYTPVVDEAYCQLVNDIPACPQCGAIARPNILMFGDWDWQEARTAAQETALMTWLSKVNYLAIIEMGAGTAIPSVRHLGERLVRTRGKHTKLLRINPNESQVPNTGKDNHYYGVNMGALEALQQLDGLLQDS